MPDGERFLALLAPHRARLLAVSRTLLRCKADADDAVQDAVLHAWRDFARYREGTRFGAWILRYLLNTIRNRNRRLHLDLEVRLPEELPAPEVVREEAEAYERLLSCPEGVLEGVDGELARAIRNLKPAPRAVFLLRSVGELSYREISDVLSIPEGTAMSHLFRARRELRRRLRNLALECGLLNPEEAP